MAVTLKTPEDFFFGEFEGLREIQYFSNSLPSTSASSSDAYVPPPPQSNLYKKEAKYEQKEEEDEEFFDDDDFGGGEQIQVKSASQFQAKRKFGVAPVKMNVELTMQGREFKFEKLLVNEIKLWLEGDYKKEAKKNQRKTGGMC